MCVAFLEIDTIPRTDYLTARAIAFAADPAETKHTLLFAICIFVQTQSHQSPIICYLIRRIARCLGLLHPHKRPIFL